jgi:hypothetical protein
LEIPPAAGADLVSEADFSLVPLAEESKGGEARGEALSKYKLPEHTVQVLNTRTATVHLSDGEGTWCNAWRCGSREDPVPTAEFALDSSRWDCNNPVAFCINCHSLKTVIKMGGALILDGEPQDASSSSASESSTSSSDSE